MNHFHLGNEKIDVILEVVMGLMEKDGKKSMHEAAEKCRIFYYDFIAFVQKKTIKLQTQPYLIHRSCKSLGTKNKSWRGYQYQG